VAGSWWQNALLDLAICALTELTRVYVLDDRLSDEERCHLEIEKLEKRAFSVVSSSWFYLYNKQDFEAAIAKADEAIAMAKTEGDTSTVYTALSAKGQALELAYSEDVARETVAEILRIVRPYYREQAFIDRGNDLAAKLRI
jgi:hypothetical protein